MNFIDIQSRYENLDSLWTLGSLETRTFSDQSRADAFYALLKLQKILRSETDLFAPLREWLSHLHWDLRGFVATEEKSAAFWKARIESLNHQLAAVNIALDDSKLAPALALRTALETLQEDDRQYAEFLCRELSSHDSAVVVERRWQMQHVEDFLASQLDLQGVPTLHLGSLTKGARKVFSNYFFLTAPRSISDNYMRALILGGAIPRGTFMAPNWLLGANPQKIRQDLAPGLFLSTKPTFNVVGPLYSGTNAQLTDEEYQIFTIPITQGEFSKFSASGSVNCRLVEIAGGFVMPVELDAARVSVLSLSDDGGLEVQYKVPGQNLEVGDILFELQNGAEEEFLMDEAQLRMGSRFKEFSLGRARWKERARSWISELGYSKTVSFLRSKGVSTADYLEDWLANQDFTTPRATKDWRNLLVALDFSDEQTKKMIELGAELRATLISTGQDARKQMADSVSQADIEKIFSREVVTKQLDDFGDAVFVLGMVEALGTDVRRCEPNEIRKVLRR